MITTIITQRSTTLRTMNSTEIDRRYNSKTNKRGRKSHSMMNSNKSKQSPRKQRSLSSPQRRFWVILSPTYRQRHIAEWPICLRPRSLSTEMLCWQARLLKNLHQPALFSLSHKKNQKRKRKKPSRLLKWSIAWSRKYQKKLNKSPKLSK
jgi:hypothetical protein